MALPPTGLTNLLYSAGRTPEAICAALKEHGCLTRQARQDLTSVKGLIAEVLDAERSRPPMPGPSTVDNLARALRDSPFLNARGLVLAVGPPVDTPRLSSGRSRVWWGLVILTALLFGLALIVK